KRTSALQQTAEGQDHKSEPELLRLQDHERIRYAQSIGGVRRWQAIGWQDRERGQRPAGELNDQTGPIEEVSAVPKLREHSAIPQLAPCGNDHRRHCRACASRRDYL